jgi:TatD DNase family protein
MILTDTHTHLYSEEFDHDRNEMIQRAIDAGVSRFFVPSIDSSYTQKMYDLEAQFPENIFLMMGLHPCYVKENYLEELVHVETELAKRKFYAIGEIGIDLFWDKSFLKQQQQVFKHQIQLAKKHKLAINIHCREAFDEVFEVLDSEKSTDLFGIFHCFTGTLEQAQKIQEYGGFMLGLGGVLTYKKSGLDEVVKDIPLDMIVLETDSPYLPPTPHRGKRNESAYLIHIAEKLAEIKQMKLTEVAEITTANARRMFNLIDL